MYNVDEVHLVSGICKEDVKRKAQWDVLPAIALFFSHPLCKQTLLNIISNKVEEGGQIRRPQARSKIPTWSRRIVQVSSSRDILQRSGVTAPANPCNSIEEIGTVDVDSFSG